MEKIKKYIVSFCFILLAGSISGCSKKEEVDAEPDVVQVRSICELATLECYYHDVVKFEEQEDVLFTIGDRGHKKFWIEYSGIVKVGIDMSKVKMSIKENAVTITIPKAEVLSCKVDETSLDADKYIAQTGWLTEIEAEDEVEAFAQAKEKMEETAKENTSLLLSAQDRAKTLIENYINNMGTLVNKTYEIKWKEIEEK